MFSQPVLLPLQEMPLMGFGTFIGAEADKFVSQSMTQKVTENAVFNALKAGCRHLDCAANYGNDEAVGHALARAFKPVADGGLGLKREEVWITTKGSASSACLDGCLERMGLKYVDLYLLHHPQGFEHAEQLRETWSCMTAMTEKGKARHVGVSNQYHEHISRLVQVCRKHELKLPYANQIEVNPKNQEVQLVAECQKEGIKVIAYSPLGYLNASLILEDPVIVQISQKLQATPAQTALAWNMARGVAVIPKSKTESRVIENMAACALKLDVEDMDAIAGCNWDFATTDTANGHRENAKKIVWEVEAVNNNSPKL